MTRLEHEPAVIRLASELGLDWGDPVASVIKHCKKKIATWAKKAGGVRTVGELEALACRELRLVFEEVETDDELQRLIEKYVDKGEFVFAHLADSFDEHTYATLLERQHVDATARDRYVAVIDCRGSKGYRRFFTRWHEIAHLLTMTRQLELPFHRSTDRDPLERVMDVVAGEVGFYEPIFAPALQRELGDADLTFDAVDCVRDAVCPDASFQATLLACVRHAQRPTLYVEAGLGLKKAERAMLTQPGLFPEAAPKPTLRALTVVANDTARKADIRIHRNMRVPRESIVHCDIDDRGLVPDRSGSECLSLWTSSDGTSLPPKRVNVQTRVVRDRVMVLIAPERS